MVIFQSREKKQTLNKEDIRLSLTNFCIIFAKIIRFYRNQYTQLWQQGESTMMTR
jgi:hypothetical protein